MEKLNGISQLMPLWRRGLNHKTMKSKFASSIPVHGTSSFSFPFFFSPFFFPFFFLHGRWCPLYVFPFFFATHHPPVITTCSWGSVGPLPWTSQSLRWPSSFTHVCTRKKGTTAVLLYTAVLRVLEKKGTTAVLLYTAVPVSYTHLTLPTILLV